MRTTTSPDRKRTNLFLALSGIFIANALLAELIGVKIFSGEALLGLPGAQIPIKGTKLDFNLTAGVIIWPAVFITTDIINEYFGKAGVKKVSILTVMLILYAFSYKFSNRITPCLLLVRNKQHRPGRSSF